MEINTLAVLVGAIAAMVIGMLWHSKLLFGTMYMDAAGMDMNMPPEKMKEMQKKMWQYYVTQFLLAALQVWVLAHFVIAWHTVSGVTTAFWIWLGFVMPTVAGACLWSARPRAKAWKMFWISTGYQLAIFIVFGFILSKML